MALKKRFFGQIITFQPCIEALKGLLPPVAHTLICQFCLHFACHVIAVTAGLITMLPLALRNKLCCGQLHLRRFVIVITCIVKCVKLTNMESNKGLLERSSSSVCELALQNAGTMCALQSTDNNTVIIAQLRGVSKVFQKKIFQQSGWIDPEATLQLYNSNCFYTRLSPCKSKCSCRVAIILVNGQECACYSSVRLATP